ncbi:hypothetical protein EDB84DRAFT_1439345 [Lactarius hengduanensis]|nr:hypothetical protein EDB84DRAFT_1439345 [Lactarius hengduanensis]
MDEAGRLTRRSGAFAVREEDAELGYGQGGGNVSVGKRCSRRDERSAVAAGRAAAAVAEKGKEEEECRRRRRKSATRGWRTSRKHKVPGSSDLADLAAGGASTWTPGGIQWERESHWTEALAMRVGRVEGSRLKRRVMQPVCGRLEDQSGGCVHGLGRMDVRRSHRLVGDLGEGGANEWWGEKAGRKEQMQHQRAVHARAGD